MTTTSKKVLNYSIFTVEIMVTFFCLGLTLDIVGGAQKILPMLQNLLFWWLVTGAILLALECGRYRVRNYI